MKITPKDFSITSETLSVALRNGYIYGIKVAPLSVSMPGWRIYVQVAKHGFGLRSEALKHDGETIFKDEETALQILRSALVPKAYREHTHIQDGKTTYCRLSFLPMLGKPTATVPTPEALLEIEDRCIECLICWWARHSKSLE